ncbi:MAG: PhoH family protein [Campylobacteraceae bacterium]|nr:PhoH family protein [Campylobacteraceae bacterium]
MNFDKYYLLDTNIILQDAKNIFNLSDDNKNLLILPETVLDELDSKKSGFEEINFQAREFARTLENAKVQKSENIDGYKIISLQVEDLSTASIVIISKDTYNINTKNTSLSIINDRKILEIASFAKEYFKKDIVFLSLDIMARIRAISLDIKADSLRGSRHEEFSYEFIKNIEINFSDLEHLESQDIRNFDKNYEIYNYSYCFKIKESDQVVLAYIENEKIRVLNETEVRNQIITPLNKEQLFFCNAILNQFYNVIVVEAKAGSGKTLLALSGALKLIKRKDLQKVIYIRNSIESLDKGEDVGYLPGLEEKFAIYNHPLMDSLDYIIRTEHKKNRSGRKDEFSELEDKEVLQRVELLRQNYSIETMWVGEMRGRTLSNSFVIVDEAQNMSNKTMQMVLSRIDNTCKVVVLGSNKQIDNFYVNKYTNSLTTLLKSTQKETDLVNIFAIRLKKVLRGPITEWAELIFTKKN